MSIEKIKTKYKALNNIDITHKMRILLEINDSINNEDKDIECDFLIMHEGYRTHAYDDHTGKNIKQGEKIYGCITIGCGFNMSRNNAKKEWQKAGLNLALFEQVKSGKISLNEEQIKQLLIISLNIREQELRNIIHNWDNLPSCVKIGLSSTYYNTTRLFKTTNIIDQIEQYTQTRNEKWLCEIANTLCTYKHKSAFDCILRQRRKLEGMMICGCYFEN